MAKDEQRSGGGEWLSTLLEYAIFLGWTLMVTLAPWTKVEESFNVQAAHDILVHGRNLSVYDHHSFPGPVPRSFLGPLALSALALIPARFIHHYGLPKYHLLMAGTSHSLHSFPGPVPRSFLGPLALSALALIPARFIHHYGLPKYHLLMAVRLVLGFYVWLGLRWLSSVVGRVLGESTRRWFLLLTLTQFHFAFYATRPLPNTFALTLVLPVLGYWLSGELLAGAFVATVAAAVLRMELLLLFAPLFLPAILTRRLHLISAIAVGLVALLLSLGLSVLVDSYFWDRWLWPEGEVFYFNVILNKSHQWGRMPFLWYFYSALPRALGLAYPIALLSAPFNQRRKKVLLPALAFVFLYSFLDHKELRFIVYALPLFNIAAADCLAQLYDKREGLKPTGPELMSADYALVGSDTLRAALRPYEKDYHKLHTVQAFAGIRLPSPLWKFWEVGFRYRDAVAILMPNTVPKVPGLSVH